MKINHTNKQSAFGLALLFVIITSLILSVIAIPVWAQDETPTETFTPTVTEEPEISATPVETATPTEELIWEPTSTPTPYRRPLITIQTYSAGEDVVTPGNDFTLTLSLQNQGSTLAGNVIATFQSNEFLPLDTGGVKAVSELGAGKTVTISQPMWADFMLWGYPSGTVQVNLSYTDINGMSYSETFTITISLKTPNYTAPTMTPTVSANSSSQLVVDTYSTDIDPLQPGSIFNLSLVIHNLGLEEAKNVVMVLGGGVDNIQSFNNTDNGNSGLSGGSADLTNFAPLGTSNVIYLDSIKSGVIITPSVQLIVNVNTDPGAYPFKISFVYEDDEGNRIVDDQVITLLVYSLPKVEISFYRDPGVLMTNEPGFLPIQIINFGKTTTVLGNLVVSSETATLTENSIMVGALEPGGYFTMDATAWPTEAGPLLLTVMVNYTDDFNQTRTIEQTLEVIVEAMPEPDFLMGDEVGVPGYPDDGFQSENETFFQKVWRFIKGFFGFGSEKIEPNLDIPIEEPGLEAPLYNGKG